MNKDYYKPCIFNDNYKLFIFNDKLLASYELLKSYIGAVFFFSNICMNPQCDRLLLAISEEHYTLQITTLQM